MNSNHIPNFKQWQAQAPEITFQELGFPITYVEGITIEGKGRDRKLKFRDKTLFSPEIVATVYFEELGHKANWSEGLALSIVISAIKRYLTEPLFKHLKYIGIKPEKVEEAQQRYVELKKIVVENYTSRHGNAEGLNFEQIYAKSIEESPPRIAHDNIITRLDRQDQLEKDWIEQQRDLLFSLNHLLNQDRDEIDLRVNSSHSTAWASNVDALLNDFNGRTETLKRDKSIILDLLKLPEKDGDKTNPRNKFINDWTLNFSKTIIDECDINYLLDLSARYSEIHPRWDLAVIDKDSKKIRFVEVKMHDKFTEFQVRRLMQEVLDGEQIELCVIKTA